MELEDIRRLSFRQPVAVVPNGIDIPEHVDQGPRLSSRTGARLLYLGRLHPIKGVELLLEAWRELQAAHPTWELVIAGGGALAYEQELRKLASTLGLARVVFYGPAFGADKQRLFLSSDLFVLPTKSENFGMAVAEALAHALPVVTTRRAPWSGLTDHRCGWWIERSQRELGEALDTAMRLSPGELREMGVRGRRWMMDEFDWKVVAKDMMEVYRWLCFGGGAPPSVRID